MKKRLAAFAVVAACTIALLGALEAGLRLAGYGSPRWHQPDRDLGWTLRPLGAGVNPAGQRDREHLLDKADGVYRIAILGDDYSEARQLPVELTYWRRLAQALERCAFQPGKRIEVLNFGVSGYGTAQQYVMLESRAVRYRPDLVLLQFSADDVRNNSFALEHDKARPFYVLDAGGRLRIDESFSSSPDFMRHSSLASHVLRGVSERSRLLQLASARHAPPGLDAELSAPPRERLWDEAWRITEGLIAMAADFSARNGARFVLVSAPADRPDVVYPERRIAEFARGKGIPAVVLGSEPLSNRQPNPRSAESHRAAADSIARALCTTPESTRNEPSV
jgi:hypothetical protein